MAKVPGNSKRFSQPNNSDNTGNIWSSLGLDLTSNIGRIRVAPRGLIVSKSSDSGLSNMTTPVAFRMFATNSSDQKIWAIAGKMFYNDGLPNDPFVQDGTSGSPAVGDGSDMELFNGALYVIGTAEIRKYTGSAWTEIGANIGTPRTTACVYAGRLYYAKNTSAISSIDLADTNVNATSSPNTNLYTLQLADFGAGSSTANRITSIRASSNRIWIATLDATSQNYSAGRAGKVFEWDGVSTQANKVYYLDSIGALALVIKDDLPYVVDADGKLLGFTGSAFKEVARLPVPPDTYLKNPTNAPTQQFIHPRGITVKNDRILILINNQVDDNDETIIENLPSGVWEYDPKIGLYHKYSVSYWQDGVSTTRTDYMQNRVALVGALFGAKSSNDSAGLNGDLLYGVRYYTTATASAYGIFINDSSDTISKIGYIVLPFIDSGEVEDKWQKVYTMYKQFFDAADKIIVKFRLYAADPTEVTITWVDANSFTTTGDLSGYEIGDEVEITQGKGGGQIAHIYDISESSGTYTVEFTDDFVGASGTAKARFQKWQLAGTTSDPTKQFEGFLLTGASSISVQVKVVMYFTSKDELWNITLVNSNYLPGK